MAIKKIEIRPRGDGTYSDVLYPKTSVDQVEGLGALLPTADQKSNLHKNHVVNHFDGRPENLITLKPVALKAYYDTQSPSLGSMRFFTTNTDAGIPSLTGIGGVEHGIVETIFPWMDHSGGPIIQIYKSGLREFVRAGNLSTNTWSLWGPKAIYESSRPAGINLNDYVTHGTYTLGGGLANAPSGVDWGVLNVEVSGDVIIQTAKGIASLIYTRTKTSSQPWSAWQAVLTSTHYNELFNSVSNGKSAVANAITQKGVATSATAEFATMANNISQISTGRKFASGSASSNGPFTFRYFDDSGNYACAGITVDGLGFTPSTIVSSVVINGWTYSTTYNKGAVADSIQMTTYNGYITTTSTIRIKPNGGNGYVQYGGFRIPVMITYYGYSVNWQAYE